MEQQIKMLDDMIAENPDSTIKEFMELLKDVEAIEAAPKFKLPVKTQLRGTNGRFIRSIWLHF